MAKEQVGLCPFCGSDQLTETNTVYAYYPIEKWENGEPSEYGCAETDWSTSEKIHDKPYHCETCNEDFSQPKFEWR